MKANGRAYGRTAGGLSLDPSINPLTARIERARAEVREMGAWLAEARIAVDEAEKKATKY